MDASGRIAAQHNLMIIEDAAQAYCAERNSCRVGAFGDMASFGMNPMKLFAACGESGIVVVDDPTKRDRLIALRYNGCLNPEVF